MPAMSASRSILIAVDESEVRAGPTPSPAAPALVHGWHGTVTGYLRHHCLDAFTVRLR